MITRQRSDMMEGCIHKTNQSGLLEIVSYKTSKEVVVKFIESGREMITCSTAIRGGNVFDRMMPRIYGVGCIGIGEYGSKLNGKPSAAYHCWFDMLERCYCERYKLARPTYSNATCCDEWHNLQNFAKWYEENLPANGEKYQLDKDILSSGKVYSPETCLLVPAWLNTFILGSRDCASGLPIGVSVSGSGKFNAFARSFGKNEFIGVYESPVMAGDAWLARKIELAKSRRGEMDDIDGRIFGRVMEIIKSLAGK